MKKLLTNPAWAFIINYGVEPRMVPWGCGTYWQLPIFHTRKDARTWAKENQTCCFRKLIRVKVTRIHALDSAKGKS